MNETGQKKTHSALAGIAARAALVVMLIFTWSFASGDRLPASMKLSALAAEKRTPPKTPEEQAKALSAMRVFSRVMLLMKENYVDPNRIDPWKMLKGAVDAIERTRAEVMAETDDEKKTIAITVGTKRRVFSGESADNLWTVSFEIKKIFDYLAQELNLDGKNDARDIEYAAINGMLSTLDPHSIMLKDEYFRELSLQSKGEFGGLGFVLQMKEGDLTIIRVMKDTPAKKAGLRSKDVIAKINGESMVNADLSEAVDRIRGKPGTTVKLTIARKGWKAPREMELTRAIIHFDSVQSKLLKDSVAYVRLKGFQGNTAKDVQAALSDMRKKAGKAGLKGLVLDLRGNPGGLLDQAGLIADMFLSKGTIVTTVGYSDKLRDAIHAKPGSPEESLPVIVLANSASASASEIVAGALKNNDRAMVVGRQTFGKGSVQVLYDKFSDKGALKLTIAQYLTPGGISIQEVGITPDIELVPGRISKERLDFFAPEQKTSEADLEQHLGNPDADTVAARHEDVVRKESPLETFLYLREAPRPKADAAKAQAAAKKALKAKGKGSSEADEEEASLEDMAEYEGIDPDTDEIVEDFPIRFARQIILASPVPSRSRMLEETKSLRQKLQKEEQLRVEKAIGELGIDWSPAPKDSKDSETGMPGNNAAEGDSGLKVTLSPDGPITAGETADWTVTVTNEGAQTWHRLKAYSASANAWFDGREFVFGKIAPGETRSWSVQIRLPKELPSRREPVTLHFSADGREELMKFTGTVAVRELPHPAFAFSWNLVDDCKACNGDGLLQKGERVSMDIDIKNVGKGKSFETIASIRNKDFEDGLSLIKARKRLGETKPGETKRVRFEFELTDAFDKNEAVIQIVLSDEGTNEWVVELARLPVSAKTADAQKSRASGTSKREAFQSAGETSVLSAASPDAPVFARLPANAIVPVTGDVGGMKRILFSADGTNETVGFVPAEALLKPPSFKGKAPKPPKADRVFMREVPSIEFDDPERVLSGIAVQDDEITLKGRAGSESGIRDLYVYANSQKVFFKAAKPGETSIGFEAKIPLKEGKNVIHVVARQNREVQRYKMIIATRLSKDGEKP